MDDAKKMVVLYAFPPVPHCYSICPFAIKVESYLRLNKIPYENVYTCTFGKKGMMPYIKLGDEEEISDSNVILSRLKSLQEEDTDKNLSDEQRAMLHALTRMLEEHTTQIGFYYRYGLSILDFMQALDVPNRIFDADLSRKGRIVSFLWGKLLPSTHKQRAAHRNFTRHSNEELWSFSNDDLRALSQYLGTKEWFFGSQEATTADCVIFGHLSQFLYIPIDFPQQKFAKEHCPNLVDFIERFRAKYWPDWEEKCRRQPQTKLLKQDEQTKPRRRSHLLIVIGAAAAVIWLRSRTK
jgi:glutathione S-transferase